LWTLVGRRPCIDRKASHTPVVEIALCRQRIFRGEAAVDTKSRSHQMPGISSIRTNNACGATIVRALDEETIVRALIHATPILRCQLDWAEVAGDRRDEGPRSIGSCLGNNVDDSVHCIGTPTRRSRAAYNFDPFNVLQRDIQNIPKNSRESLRVDAPAVY